METNKIPVSFEFFKKHTYHEEWTEFMLKCKANGNHQLYDSLSNDNNKERALRLYYEAFYLRPKIREKYHIRIKPVPKKIREKLLIIPPVASDAGSEPETSDNSENYAQDVIISVDNNNEAREEESKEKNCELQVQNVSERDANSGPANEKVISNQEDLKENNIDISNDMQRDNADAANNSSPKPGKKIKYEELMPYMHCCPLTFKEFRKYSNINELVRKFCEKLKITIAQKQRVVLHRSYLLFYLAPEHRKITPIKDIKLLDSCPSDIKDKFFSIPTKISLENTNDATTTNEEKQKINKITSGENQTTVDHASMSEATDKQINVNNTTANNIQQANTSGCQVADTIASDDINTETSNKIESLHTQLSDTIVSNDNQLSPSQVNQVLYSHLPVSPDDFKKFTYYEEDKFVSIPNEEKEKINKIINAENQTTVDHATTSEATDKQINVTNTTVNNIIQQANTSGCQVADTIAGDEINTETSNKIESLHTELPETIVSNDNQLSPSQVNQVSYSHLPVSLDDFKKFTYYEEIVNRLFEIKAQDDRNLYNKYKNSQEAVCKTLENYYRAFYAYPAIREIWPVRFKPIPNFLKERLLKTPDGITSTLPTNFKVEELVSPELNTSSVNAKQLAREESVEKVFSKEGGAKRASTDNESPSPKRRKVQETQEGKKQRKKCYKDLLPYAHCCPITLSKFIKYTNVSELFKGYCEKRYNCLKKLPYMLQRAYILYYLAPENRVYKPFNKLKPLKTCPQNLRDKIFEIPKVLSLKDEHNNDIKYTYQIDTQTEAIDEQIPKITDEIIASKPRAPIEIIENRVLPPITLDFINTSAKECSQCCNTSCIFHHVSHLDFMIYSNVLSVLPKPYNIADVKKCFKSFVYNIIKEKISNEKYLLHSDILCKLLQYNSICETCENNIKTILDLNVSMESVETERTSNTTVIDTVPESNKSTNPTETFGNNKHSTKLNDLLESLKKDKIFAIFSKKLLAKINESCNNSVDFDCEIYKMFLQCNKIPLKEILNDFCQNNEYITQRILNENVLTEALQRYYYYKYLTNKNFALKYPPEIKENTGEQQHQSQIKKEVIENVVETHGNENVDSNNLNSNNSRLEKAKRIFFRNVEKINSLSYVVRTSFGFKQLILRNILSLTHNEFLKMTRIYEGEELYADNHIAECMYRYVFRTPLVWPTNLYIPLEILFKFLHDKGIIFLNHSIVFKYISPKLLHWSIMLSCTNILDCLKIDYEQRTGKLLDDSNNEILEKEYIDYYNRCWKHEKWLGSIPIIDNKYYKDFFNHNNEGDVPVKNDATEKIVKEIVSTSKEEIIEVYVEDDTVSKENLKKPVDSGPSETAANEYLIDVYIEDDAGNVQKGIEKAAEATGSEARANLQLTPNFTIELKKREPLEMDISRSSNKSIKEFNYVIIPNTQQQIEMLPSEETGYINDPLNSNNNDLVVNISSSNSESSVTNGQPIKSEKIESKLLKNIRFCEDDNGNIQCTPYEEEIVNLDFSMEPQTLHKSLPPSQINFDNMLTDIMVNDDDIYSLLNFAQNIISPEESNDGTHQPSQQMPNVASTQSLQLPDVSIESSGELLSHEKIQDHEEPAQKETTEICNMVPEAQHLRSNESLERINNTAQQLLCKNPSEGSVVKEKTLPYFVVIPVDSNNKSLPNVPKNTLPLQQGIQKGIVLNKNKKYIAKVKPLTANVGIVPQIQHNTRPLRTILYRAASSSNSNTKLDVTPTTSNSTTLKMQQTTPDSNLQMHSSPTSFKTIYISQELIQNSSIFDNTDLLQIADHNYFKQSSNKPEISTNLQQQAILNNSKLQPKVIINRRNSMFVKNNTETVGNVTQTRTSLPYAANEQPVNSHQQPAQRTTRSSSCYLEQPKKRVILNTGARNLSKDTNDKNLYLRSK